jgi:pilus assembly protein CpaB
MKLSLPKKFKPGKTWIILGVALSIGLLAALAARSFLSHQMEAIEARSKGETVDVVVAKRELKKGERLSSENVAVRSVPLQYSHSQAILPDAFDRVEGQVLAYPVNAGEMIIWGLMETKRVPTFSARVAPGHRALTVAVDEINSISGMLEPGDMVDLMATIDKKGKKITVPLLQSIPVMATGQRSVDDPKSGERREYSTVTLETSPEQAQNIIVAREAGKLTALLRNPQDKQPIGNSNADVASLLGLTGGNTREPSDNQVPVIYGGGNSKIPEEALLLSKYQTPAANPAGQPDGMSRPAAAAATRPGQQAMAGQAAIPNPAQSPVAAINNAGNGQR